MNFARSQLQVQTGDGLQLALERLRPEGPSRGAVVLLHGLGANSHMFLAPRASLAEHLAERGFDCFVPDLRGAGDSDKPRGTFALDEYLEQDLPAILDGTLRASGEASVAWVGLSMGGLLLLMYGIEHPDLPVHRLITLGSALDYRPGKNVYRDLLKLRPLAGPLRTLHFDVLARAFAPLTGLGPALPHEAMNFNRSNVERSVAREIMARGFSAVPLALFDDLATAFGARGFTRAQGRIAYLERAEAFRTPTLMLAGSRDVQCPPEAARATFEALRGVKDKSLVLFGRAQGQADEYGHLDLVLGKRAKQEVWPHIEAFLGGAASLAPQRVGAS